VRSDPLEAYLEQLASAVDALATTTVDAQTRATAIAERLASPLRLVVAGRVSSGKSTLVNALLGQRVAPTDISECTRIVTWFRYGSPQRVDVHRRDGTVTAQPLTSEGRLPTSVGVPVSDVARLDVWLANDTLRHLTLVDTPGFSSASKAIDPGDHQTSMDSDSWAAAESCDAMLFVLNQGLRADELAVLQAFQASQAGPASAVNTVGVLTKADRLGNGDVDAWQVASTMAKRYAERHRDDVATVLPLMGLLAETTECARLSDDDLATLQALAALDEATVAEMLLAVDTFVGTEVDVSAESRTRLLELLNLYGIEQAMAMIRAGTDTARRLRDGLGQLSGLRDLNDAVRDDIARRATTLRLLWAADAVHRLSYSDGLDDGARRSLRSMVERIRLDPAMQSVNELHALHVACHGAVTLPDVLADDLRRLALSQEPVLRLGAASERDEDLLVAARDGAARWRTFLAGATPAQAEIARVAIRSYQRAFAATTTHQHNTVPT
jgi:GTP-binding protein EngB required for normal cell division